jgi:arylsulfatase A-like enzyme
VPLIVRWPGTVKPGANTSALVSGDDLAPTLLEMAGIALPENLTGVSFLALLHGEAQPKPREQVIAERGAHGSSLPHNSASFDLGRAIVMDRYKLIYNATWQLPYQPVDFGLDDVRALADARKLPENLAAMSLAEHRPMFELYDLREDPFEMTNLAGNAQTAEVERDLKGRLAAWMIHHHDFVPLPVTGQRKKAQAKNQQAEE